MHAELFYGDRRLRFVKHQTKDGPLGEGGELCRASRHLNDADLFWIDAQFFQRHQEGHMIGGAETAYGQCLAFEIRRFFYLRAGNQLGGKKIQSSSYNSEVTFL